ncbi:MAG: hypothetical protein OEN55_16060 [Alphaproteobacteria bacterium]|nr:hypothetical protein [Alphaproteobacteria bacterium]
MRLITIALAACTLAASGSLAMAGEAPTEDGWYVSLDACPFECCTYRDWVAESDTTIYGNARGTIGISVVRAGQTVEAKTGNVYVVPVPVEVAYETTIGPLQFGVGETFYLLDYLGEGYQRVWLADEPTEFDTSEMWDPDTIMTDLAARYLSCETPSDRCWWRIAPEHRRQATEWWVLLRLSDGTEGWSSAPENFSNKDACG